MNDIDDGELIRRSLREPDVFEEVFSRHFAEIYSYVRRRLGTELGDELAAETFLIAFRARVDFDRSRGSALPWLHGIAANLIRLHFRTEQRRLIAYQRQAGSGMVADELVEDVIQRLDARSLGPALAAGLAGLSAPLRDVLLLHAWAELSPAEIGEALACSSGAVRVRLSRARRTLQAHLQEHEETMAR